MSKILSVILHELKRNGGSVDERELYESVAKILRKYDYELTLKEFNKALLSLETRGLITVTTLKKNMRVVRLLSR